MSYPQDSKSSYFKEQSPRYEDAELPPYEPATAAAASSSATSLNQDRRESYPQSSSAPRRQYNPSGAQYSQQYDDDYSAPSQYSQQQQQQQQQPTNRRRNPWLDSFKYDSYQENANYYQDQRMRSMNYGGGCGGCGNWACGSCRRHPRPGLITLGVGLVVAGCHKVEDRSQRKREKRALEARKSEQ